MEKIQISITELYSKAVSFAISENFRESLAHSFGNYVIDNYVDYENGNYYTSSDLNFRTLLWRFSEK